MTTDNPLQNIPDIDFAPQKVDDIIGEMVRDYEAEYYRQTGKQKSIVPASEERIILYTEAARFFAAYQMIDQGCKMNLLKYSKGEYLDNLVATLHGLERLPAQKSISRARFSLSAVLTQPVTIPKGTRMSTPSKIYFETQAPLVIPAGEISAETDIIACETGIASASLLPGQVNILVDPIPYVARVENLEMTQGGTDVEEDESLALRAFYYPRSYSVAGPKKAYAYFVSSYSQAIEGISVETPEPGRVDIRITLQGGELPTQSYLDGLAAYLEDKRPQSDDLFISAPEVMEYSVDCTYYISASDSSRKEEIMTEVNKAVQEYIKWQGAKIGRDLLPDKLVSLAVQAGARRLEITQPVYWQVASTAICRCAKVNAVFGGIEDD